MLCLAKSKPPRAKCGVREEKRKNRFGKLVLDPYAEGNRSKLPLINAL